MSASCGQRLGSLGAFLSLLAAPVGASPDWLVAEAYRDPAIRIHAGLAGGGERVIHFGDELVMVVDVAFDPQQVAVSNFNESLFADAFSSVNGVYLSRADIGARRGDPPLARHLRGEFRFQLAACPNAGRPTCPGERYFPVPELQIELEDRATGEIRVLAVQPEPQSLTVLPTLQLDANKQLFPFEVYFPNGGYPQPLTGQDGTRTSIIATGLAMVLLTGGLFMWPFRKRSKAATAKAVVRWKEELDALRAGDVKDEARFLDRLRRCLVWYCNDELGVDAFIWLDLAERSDDERDAAEDDKSLSGLRDLFVDVLQSQGGQTTELLGRLEALIARGGKP